MAAWLTRKKKKGLLKTQDDGVVIITPPKEDAYGDHKSCGKSSKYRSASPSGKEYNWKLQEIWEDYPAPNYEAVHTYCEVAFDDSGRTYYYRTRNPELRVGDTVYVPFGYKAPKRIGVIVSMEDFEGYDVPFPLEKTKYIIGKV